MINKLRSALIQYFLGKADYRSVWTVSGDDDPDGHNKCYAESLQKMAEFIAELPDDDPSLVKLLAFRELFQDEVFSPAQLNGGAIADVEAVHCGPRWNTMDAEELGLWFASWVDIVVKEATQERSAWD